MGKALSSNLQGAELTGLPGRSFRDPDLKEALWVVLTPGAVPPTHMGIRGQTPWSVAPWGCITLGRTPFWRDPPSAGIPSGHLLP